MLYAIFDIAKIHITWYFLVLIIIDGLILTVLESYLMIMISEGSFSLVPHYLLIKVIGPFIGNVITRSMIFKLDSAVRRDFTTISVKKFDRMSFESKNTKTSTIFYEKLNSANNGIHMLLDWGLVTSINLVGTICGVLWTFIQKDLIIELFIVLVCCFLLYYLFIRTKQNEFTKIDKHIRKKIQYCRSQIQLYLIPFQYREYNANHIISQIQKSEDNYQYMSVQWNYISSYTNIGNQLISAILVYFVATDIPSFMLIMLTMNQLAGAVNQSTQFMTQYNRIRNDYATLEDFWNGVGFEKESDKKFPTHDLKVIKIDVSEPNINFKVRLDPSCGPISLAPGEKIYISGPTGGGKSTTVKALFGKKEGVVMNKCLPKELYHNVADYYQEIKEKMPSSMICIRDYFKGQPEDDIIDKYLKMVFSPNELARIKETLLAQTKDDIVINFNGSNDNIVINFDNETIDNISHSPYDMAINEKISGGQKSRLILAQRGYEVDMNNKGIIVLDEPCPDVDNDTYINVMNQFFKNYKDKIIIMIGHLCECKKAKLQIKWTQQFHVSDGLITRVFDSDNRILF